jgi:hypothetical protein
MKKISGIATSLILCLGLNIVLPQEIYAGNEDRAGQAGAGELLINPWARSSGWAGCNTASVRGLESMFINVAGTAFTQKTELVFARTNWLSKSGVNINAFGITQKVGEAGVLGIGLMSMDFGEIQITTVDLPEGGVGSYKPQYMNLAISYAKAFSNSIYGGVAIKMISENISDLNTQGVAFDAGIQYVTGFNEDRNNLKFGIALKNVGPPMKYSGDGLAFRTRTAEIGTGAIVPPYEITVEQRSATFELPSLTRIGAAYDFKLSEGHRLTTAANFTSNSFTKDQYNFGLEYAFKEHFMVRGGMVYEEDIFDEAKSTSVFTGPTGGFTLEVPIGKSNKTFGLDYSFRATKPFDGSHSFGARINL